MKPELHLTAAIWCGQRGGWGGDISMQLAKPKAVYFLEHLLCCLCVLSQAQLFYIVTSKCHFWRVTELRWGAVGGGGVSPYANQSSFLK